MSISAEEKEKLLRYLIAKEIRFMKPSDIRRNIGNAAKETGISIEALTEIVEKTINEEAQAKIAQLRPRREIDSHS